MSNKPHLKRTMKNWKNVNREMARTNKKFPKHMVEIPKEHWPEQLNLKYKPIAAWRSNRFFVQVVEEPSGAIRISINRTALGPDYDYVDGITWDEIFRIKNEIGYADKDCIEIYPAKDDIVNVANIRHIFILEQPHPLNWSNKQQ